MNNKIRKVEMIAIINKQTMSLNYILNKIFICSI